MDSQFIITEREKWHKYATNLLTELEIDPNQRVVDKIKEDKQKFQQFVDALSKQLLTQEISFQCHISDESVVYSPYLGEVYFSSFMTFEELIDFLDQTFDEYLNKLPHWKSLQYFINFNKPYKAVLEKGFPHVEFKKDKVIIYALWEVFQTKAAIRAINRLRRQYLIYRDTKSEKALITFFNINYGVLNKSLSNNNLPEYLEVLKIRNNI